MEANQNAVAEASSFVAKVNEFILFPLIYLLMSVAFLVFLWGCAQYIFGADNDQARAQGRKHILWGIVGLFIMVSAWSILGLVAGTFGLGDEVDCAKDPSGSGCAETFNVDATPLQF